MALWKAKEIEFASGLDGDLMKLRNGMVRIGGDAKSRRGGRRGRNNGSSLSLIGLWVVTRKKWIVKIRALSKYQPYFKLF